MVKTRFAVFDIDGTLIRWQLYHAVVDELARQGMLGKDAKNNLRQSRMRWKRREHAAVFREYELTVIDTFETAFNQLDAAAFDKAVDTVIKEYGDQTYAYTKNLISQLKSKDYVLLAISGSHQELVAKIAKQYGFDDFIGTVYERHGHKFSGQKQVASDNKKLALQSLVKKHNLGYKGSLAIGDSASDAAMLELVEQPIAFNPDQTLYRIAKQHGWKIVVERKNVTYELGRNNDHYQLA